MSFKNTKHFLNKLEDVFAESDYVLRYEKGNFKSGYCLLNDQKVIVVNKYFTIEGKIHCLLEILRQVPLEIKNMTEKNKALFLEITQTSLAI